MGPDRLALFRALVIWLEGERIMLQLLVKGNLEEAQAAAIKAGICTFTSKEFDDHSTQIECADTPQHVDAIVRWYTLTTGAPLPAGALLHYTKRVRGQEKGHD